MTITVTRDKCLADATFGKLTLDSPSFSCDTLEPPKDHPMPGRRAVPAGHYSAKIRFSPHHGYAVVGLYGIPGYSDVEIHPGNDVYDTLACILVGNTRGYLISHGQTLDAVLNSRVTFNALMSALGWSDYKSLTTWDAVREAELKRRSEFNIFIYG